MKLLKDITTGVDGQTYDIGRVLGLIFAVHGLALESWHVFHNSASFSMQEFGLGVGAMAAGIGAMIKLKQETEPK